MYAVIDLGMVKRAQDALRDGNVHAALLALDEFNVERVFSDEVIVDTARRIRRERYEKYLEEFVLQIHHDWTEGEYAGKREMVFEAISELATVSHESEARDVLEFSPNVDEIESVEIGRGGVPWCEMAYYALKGDICEDLREIHGVDVNARPPKEPVSKCNGCDEWRPREGFKDGCCADCQE